MYVNKEEIIKLFHAKKSGTRGWYLGNCAYCGAEEKLGLVFGHVSSFDCKKCQRHGNIFHILKHVGRLDLFDRDKIVNINSFLENKILIDIEEEINLDLPKFNPPVGWRKITHNSYLESRGFDEEDYKKVSCWNY